MNQIYSVLIGSVGDDSHTIGMKLLELALRENGFFVKNIGILNVIDDFFYRAKDFNIIFISCTNGHADLYFQPFPYKLIHFKLGNASPKIWYLGGNLATGEDTETLIRKYRGMGFDYVAPKPVPIATIKRQLHEDIQRKGIKPLNSHRSTEDDFYHPLNLEAVNDRPLDDAEFTAIRNKVLARWPTGSQVRSANIRRNHGNPRHNFHKLLSQRNGIPKRPILQPRTGVAHVGDEISILKYLRRNGLDVSSVQLDAASRKCMFDKAELGVLQTEPGGTSLLNGFPVPVHGISGIERIMENIDTPFQIRAGSPDHRLVYEIGLAGGASSVEGGFLCYLYPYDKDTSPTKSLTYWKYIDKLAQRYQKKYRVIINREFFGPLTCSLIEPSIPIVINVIQAILAAKGGVRCISVGLAEQGNRVQDIAALNVLKKMTRAYLNGYGYQDVTLTTVFHQYMSAFPSDETKASNLIINSSVTAALTGADRIMTKTPVEASHIPTKEDNAEGLRLTQLGINQAYNTKLNWEQVHAEAKILQSEVQSIVSQILSLGQGSLAKGAILAFEKGILDIPFSPNIYNRGKLVTARDLNGAVRFVNPDILPLEPKVEDFHKQKIYERMQGERCYKVSEILEQDLTRIWKNDFTHWPLDGHYAR